MRIMPTIISIDKKRKYINLCAWCDEKKVHRKKWLEKGYSVSDGMCENCDLD